MTVHCRVAKLPSTVIHANWLVRRRAGRVFLPIGAMALTFRTSNAMLVADADDLIDPALPCSRAE
jgi:hypothetical protein